MEKDIIKIFLLALIGSGIGYITNVLAIKLLFKPYNEIKVPLTRIRIQGLIPKRKMDIAENIGEIIEYELVNITELLDIFITEERIDELLIMVKGKIQNVIDKKLSGNPLMSGFRGMIQKYINEIIESEGRQFVHEMISRIGDEAQNEISIKKIVVEKISVFDLKKLEKIAYQISGKELRHIEMLGGILGFMIGIVQGLIVTIL